MRSVDCMPSRREFLELSSEFIPGDDEVILPGEECVTAPESVCSLTKDDWNGFRVMGTGIRTLP